MEPSPRQITAGLAVLRWPIAVVFLAAGASKAFDPATTIQSIANYHLLPVWLVAPVGWYVPWIELGCGGALLSRRLLTGGWLLALLLSTSFALFTGSALWRGLDISCGCFGTNSSSGQLRWIAALDVTMLLISIYGFKCRLWALAEKT